MDGCDSLRHLPAGERQQERRRLLPDERHLHDAAVRHRAHDPGSSAGCVVLPADKEGAVKKLLNINESTRLDAVELARRLYRVRTRRVRS